MRASAGETDAAAWRIETPTGGARLVTGSDLAAAEVLPSDAGQVDVDIGNNAGERQVLLAEQPAAGWDASLDDSRLDRMSEAWRMR